MPQPNGRWRPRLWLLLERVVRRVHVDHLERTDAAHLDDGLATRQCEVAHLLRHHAVGAGRQVVQGRLIEFLTHPERQRAADDRDVLVPGMPMWRDVEAV